MGITTTDGARPGTTHRAAAGGIDRRTFVGAAGVGLATILAGGGALAAAGHARGDEAGEGAESDDPAGSPSPDAGAGAGTGTPSEVGASAVFFTRDISPAGLVRAFKALGVSPQGTVAVKLSTGEPGGTNYLQPTLVADLVHALDATIVECTTAYGGARSTVEGSLQAAADHGFTTIAEVDIMDADGSLSLPVEGGSHLSEDLVGAHLERYDFVVSLAHFKGHAMGGFGGAIKNCAIGMASQEGKTLIHSAGASTTSWGNPAQDDFLESMAEAAKAVADYLGEGICYINVMNRLSVDCDCDAHPAAPDMADIGILASLDPVALDRACVDLVYAAQDGTSLVERIESRNGTHTLDHAEAIGLGSQTYELVDLDASEGGAETAEEARSDVLVAYFSATGATAGIAETIAAQLGADVFAITPSIAYTAEDLDYNDASSRTSIERADPSRSVELQAVMPEDFERYGTVFVGYPIWWGGASWVLDGFVAGNDFSGKTVVPFCTSGSSPVGGSGAALAALAGTGTWLDGARFPAGASTEEVATWLAGLGIAR